MRRSISRAQSVASNRCQKSPICVHNVAEKSVSTFANPTNLTSADDIIVGQAEEDKKFLSALHAACGSLNDENRVHYQPEVAPASLLGSRPVASESNDFSPPTVFGAGEFVR